MSEEMKQKWLNWLDSCQAISPLFDVTETMRKYMSGKDCMALIARWIEER